MLVVLAGAAVFAPLVATDRPLWVRGVPHAAFEGELLLLREAFPGDVERGDPGVGAAVADTLAAVGRMIAPANAEDWAKVERDWRQVTTPDARLKVLDRAVSTAAVGPRSIAGSPVLATLDPVDALAIAAWFGAVLAVVCGGTRTRRVVLGSSGAAFAAAAFVVASVAMSGDALGGDVASLRSLASDGGTVVDAPIPFAPDAALTGAIQLPPGTRDADGRFHALGTDVDGRDVASGLVWGARTSLTVGLFAVALLLAIGLVVGVLAGASRVADPIASRVIELVDAFPPLLVVMLAVAVLDRGLWVIVVVLGVTAWTKPALLTRAEVARRMREPFVDAARTLGYRRARVLFVHVLPNAVGPACVHAAFALAGAILAEAGLSFLGLGPRTASSWGQLIQTGAGALSAWWIAVFPAALLFFTVLAVRTIGARFGERRAVA